MNGPHNRFSTSVVAALLIGIVQMYFLTILWVYIAAYTPLLRWLRALGLKATALHAVIFVSDSLLNVILCLPAAYAICKLPRLLVYLILAIVPGFIWQYRLFFTDTSLIKNWPIFAPGVLLALLPLPLAALLLRRMLVIQSRH